MIWQDILVDKNLDFQNIALELAKIFEVNLSEVLVLEEITDTPIPQNIAILCQAQATLGDFKMLLSIYIHEQTLFKKCTITNCIPKFCDSLECVCLVSDGSINPYTMLLVTGNAEWKSVSLSPSELEENRYILV
ncbi:MAG: hypothetical protein DRR16_33685 [Candidatus Parabeggiatoa sp. nov. 3]|nr:MAG: hypothetical protein DRR00_34340 [Gammaproteobacteria bacterium]RKZ72817.1 MAG: hypothetical protein DRR16_33685 [Gammaproteobacteria bacterium]